ncbi:hypothetical protein EB796_004199 [Bugula neritina]|uniref:ShKT domain-containing protein n=1 Tax=Bugula neritina TaxID=10212 RepID=A0A7J7KFR8_BUGNE|nr:hypothetical protein EB796_004199 [Bugula neritina]
MGCYEDQKTRDLSGYIVHLNDNSQDACIAACRTQNVSYLGCFEDRRVRDLGEFSKKLAGTNTIEKCVSLCKSKDDRPAACAQYADTVKCEEPSIIEVCKSTCAKCWTEKIRGPNGCFDEATDCQKRKEEGKCLTEPEDMMKSCSDTCNMCFREQRVSCRCRGDPHCTHLTIGNTTTKACAYTRW